VGNQRGQWLPGKAQEPANTDHRPYCQVKGCVEADTLQQEEEGGFLERGESVEQMEREVGCI